MIQVKDRAVVSFGPIGKVGGYPSIEYMAQMPALPPERFTPSLPSDQVTAALPSDELAPALPPEMGKELGKGTPGRLAFKPVARSLVSVGPSYEDFDDGGGPVNLGRSECFDRLAGNEIGRLSLTVGALPTIVPARYEVVGNDVWIESPEGHSVGAVLENAVVAFQTDGEETDSDAWWSVVVVGLANRVDGKIVLSISSLSGAKLSCLSES